MSFEIIRVGDELAKGKERVKVLKFRAGNVIFKQGIAPPPSFKNRETYWFPEER